MNEFCFMAYCFGRYRFSWVSRQTPKFVFNFGTLFVKVIVIVLTKTDLYY